MKLNNKSLGNIKAVIWDMDGVIVDSEHHHHATEIETFKYFGVDVPEEVNRKFKGAPLIEHFKGLKEEFDVSVPLDDLLSKQNEFIKQIFSERADLFENVKKVLLQLKNYYKQGLATSTERKFVDIVLKRFGFEEVFDVITCGDEVKQGKPNPEIFLKAAQKLNLNPPEIVVIEDSMNGFKAAKAAGMLLIAHKAHHNEDLDFSLADFVVEDLREIPGILNSKLV